MLKKYVTVSWAAARDSRYLRGVYNENAQELHAKYGRDRSKWPRVAVHNLDVIEAELRTRGEQLALLSEADDSSL